MNFENGIFKAEHDGCTLFIEEVIDKRNCHEFHVLIPTDKGKYRFSGKASHELLEEPDAIKHLVEHGKSWIK